MKRSYWIVITALILTSCNLSALEPTNTPPSTLALVSPSQTSLAPTMIPIETLLARDTPTSVFTATSSVVLASPISQPVNCRFGPGISYSIIGALIIGRQAEVIGKSVDATWWYVKNPSDPSTSCWLSADFVSVEGNIETLPVVSPPEIGVTNIQVQVDPISMNVGCSAFPVIFNVKAQITVNGPTIITWRWEASNGDASKEESLLFESQGTKEVQRIQSIGSANDYWINLHVLSPNNRSGGAVFKVTCIP